MTRWSYACGALVLGLSLWQALIWLTGVPHFILPSPWRVAHVGANISRSVKF